MEFRFRQTTACLLWLGIAAVASVATAQDAATNAILFSVQTVDGERSVGVLRSLSPREIELLPVDKTGTSATESTVRHIDMESVIRCDRVTFSSGQPVGGTRSFQPRPTETRIAPRLWLTNGDRLAIELIELDDAFLTARVLSLGSQPTWKIPLELVRGYADSEHWRDADFIGRPEEGNGPAADLMLLTNGDRIGGELQGFAGGEFTFATAGGTITIPLGGIEAFAMNPELMEFPELQGYRLLAVLTDGSFVTLMNAEAVADSSAIPQFRAQTSYGQDVAFPASDLQSFVVLGRRVAMLSNFIPVKYEFTPFFSREWDYQVDRNVSAGPLIVDGREYGKGLGLHSECRLTYRLAGEYTRFQAGAGIDDAGGDQGQAWLSILVDGKSHIDRLLLTGTGGVESIEIDRLESAQQLTIVVEFGPFGDVRDHVDIVDPILVRQEAVNR